MNPAVRKRLTDWSVFLGLLLISLWMMLGTQEGILRQVRIAVLDATMRMEERLTLLSDYFRALEENERLREENMQLAAEVALLREAGMENEALRAFLAWEQQQSPPLLLSRIVAKDISRQKNTFIIAAGRADGVETGMAVVDTRGVLGKTVLVGEHYTVVQSYLNTDFRLSVHVLPSHTTGILRWDGIDPERLLLEHISRSAPVVSGQAVVTSGYSDVFPPGLPVGTIQQIIREPGSNELRVFVRPATSLMDARYAFVVLQRPDPERLALREQATSR